MRVRLLWLVIVFVAIVSAASSGDAITAQQPDPNKVRQIPPPGIEISAADRDELTAGVAALGKEIAELRELFKTKPALLALIPDVHIFKLAVRAALNHNEFYKPEEIATARRLLKQGMERAQALREGKAPWTTQTGLVVRGYISAIDGSVQPYGLVIPETYQSKLPHEYRLDVWFHGRGENLTELNFIADRQKNAGQFTPPNTIVLHPYGRYNCANKFAGEMDLFEALAAVKRQYPIDENRVSVRGFSMGGAATWHIATHHAGLWASAAPGAGFAETAEYVKAKLDEVQWYEQKLWHWYNATDYAANLFNCPTVAYSGELDRQIQAAQVMARELKTEGIELVHIIGPQTEHKYHPDSIKEISRRIDSIVAAGRNPVPRRVKFTTWTLRYNQMNWVTVDALGEHWQRARVEAEIRNNAPIQITTENVTALTLEMKPGECPLDNSRRPTVMLDKQEVAAAPVLSDRSWISRFRKVGGKWSLVEQPEDGLRKIHGLQGPIDDAFMSSFVFVRPTGKALNDNVAAWSAAELDRAIVQWRNHFRGEARVKTDAEITDADIADSNLVLWGDPASNAVLGKLIDRLPIGWNSQTVKIGEQSFVAANHVPVMIFPNPLNPNRYVVINSGFTFREAHHLTNAQQTPKLPDWAIVDLSVPPSAYAPGRIAAAGFFGERWELK
ncbi:MAG: prolyl oligopeptidase family serine peptidase [Acidobacteriota bacterium]|nr:prolyl oligopeptidase family serine peptidase [Acidobacteriota bacterium]